MKRILIAFIILPYCLYVTGQQKLEANKYANQSLITASPSATMLGVFGHTPVSHFTGTPDISIPLYEVSYKELSIDLSLRYHQAIGNKPDAFPGSTGNGWVLNTGGVITRTSRGVTSVNFPGPVPQAFNPTAEPDWSSTSVMQNYLSTQTVFVNDECRYDEYTYNFGGNSGKFYIDHNDAFRIKTPQGEDLLIEKEPVYSEFIMPTEDQGPPSCLAVMASYTNIIRHGVFKFTITDSRGIKYTFGGTSESIEFVRPGMAYAVYDLEDENTLPASWYLTSIQSPNGYKIDLTYKRDKFYITNEISVNSRIITPSKFASNNNAPKAKGIKSTLYHPCYIDKIITPISSVKFNWSIANMQLGYNFTVSNPSLSSDRECVSLVPDYYSEFYFCKYPEIKDASISGRFPNKLDGFVVFNSSDVRKKAVEFTYTNSTTTRLKLLSVKIKGDNDTDQNVPVYSFEYNTLPLPEYLSFKTDDYGFYNGANPYITSNDPEYYYNFFANTTNQQLYVDSRKPNINYTQAEILKKIIYPTGGSTEYEYENNMYGRKAKFWPASVVENTAGAGYTGGLRIKSITNYDYGTHLAGKKQYFYILNYATGGTASSGVLSFEPKHFADFDGTVTPPQNMPAIPIMQGL